MKKFVFIMLMLAFMVSACGGTSIPTPIATQAPTEINQVVASPVPAVSTSTPEATVEPAQSTDSKVQVLVTEGDNWIKSDLTTFKVGVTYVFTVTNTGRRAHIFSISHPVTEISASGIDAAKKGALLLVSQDQLFPGDVATVEYTFTEPASAGTLEFACLIFMHYKMGQFLPIVVE